MTASARSWRLANIPLPEAHLAGLAALLALRLLRPWALPGSPRVRLLLGLPVAAAGAGLAAGPYRAARTVDLAAPQRLVTAGPYALIRNPMYVAWGLIHFGAGVMAGSGWTAVTLPVASVLVHREVLAEEHRLAGLFPRDFAAYRASVPRYPPGSGSGGG